MTGTVHIYVERRQPATRYEVDLFEGPPAVIKINPRRLIRCASCTRLRYAANCSVQAYYDEHVFTCTDKAQCVKPKKKNLNRRVRIWRRNTNAS